MTSGSGVDRDLLARLNALKRSNIDLDNETVRSGPTQSVPIDPAPGRALHADLLDRFRSLSGGDRSSTSALVGSSDVPGDEHDENSKTVEELLADLGPAEQWEVGKSEETEVDDLLRSAQTALGSKPQLERIPGEEQDDGVRTDAGAHTIPSIDVSPFRAEPESEDETGQKPSKDELRVGFNQEADDVLQRLLDEVKYEKNHGPGYSDDGDNGHHATDEPGRDFAGKGSASTAPTNVTDDAFALPSAPSTLPQPAPSTEDDLAARFASLGLPSVPQTIGGPSSRSAKSTKAAPAYSDDEIDSWCIICSDDATLSCLGCDEDLYCTNCWMEGHRGEDAGAEERRHKAVQYNNRKKKAPPRRTLMGAA